MDLFDELENLAISSAYEEPKENGDTDDQSQGTIKVWQDRFGHTYEKSVEMIGLTKTAAKSSTSMQQKILSPAQARTIYLLKLEGPISYIHCRKGSKDFKPYNCPRITLRKQR